MKTRYITFLLCCLIAACKTENKSESTEANTIVTNTITTADSVEETRNPNAFDEENEEEEMNDMEFMPPIEKNSYLGLTIGDDVSDHKKVLAEGQLQTGEGEFDVHYIVYKSDTLGYAFGEKSIESIHIWDSRGATNDGIRVGTTFGELKEILKTPEVHGSEMESRVHVFNKKHMYRLEYYDIEYDIDAAKIPDTVVVKEIIITK